MKYVLIKAKEKRKATKIVIFENSYKFENIHINNQELLNKVLLTNVYGELNSLVSEILAYLESDDDSAEATSYLYDELSRIRSIILNQYEKYLTKEAINNYMKIVRFLANQLKKRLKLYNFKKIAHKSR